MKLLKFSIIIYIQLIIFPFSSLQAQFTGGVVEDGGKPTWVLESGIVGPTTVSVTNGNFLAPATVGLEKEEWHIPDRRHFAYYDLPRGNYRITLHKPPVLVKSAIANTDIYDILIHYKNTDNVWYRISSGRNGRYGKHEFVKGYENKAQVTEWTRWGPTLPAYKGTAQNIDSPGRIDVALSEPVRLYIEVIRNVGNVSWNSSGTQRRTNFAGVRAYTLPLEVKHDTTHSDMLFETWEGSLDFLDMTVRVVAQ